VKPNSRIVQPKHQAGDILGSVLKLTDKHQPTIVTVKDKLTKKVSSMASVAPMIRSSSQLWSHVRQANRASIYNVLAGCAFRNDGLKLMMRDPKIWGSAGGENASMDEKSPGGVCEIVSISQFLQRQDSRRHCRCPVPLQNQNRWTRSLSPHHPTNRNGRQVPSPHCHGRFFVFLSA
jgi:hypothetical protein